MRINSAWHKANKMPKNASFEQRVRWHFEHQKNCTCRKGYPGKLVEEAKLKGVVLPEVS